MRSRLSLGAAILTAAALGFSVSSAAAQPSSAGLAASSQSSQMPGANHAPRYYLALGDSLAEGYQLIPGTGQVVDQGYAKDLAAVFQQEATAEHQQFTLVNYGCGGETTTSMISGNCDAQDRGYTGAQLTAAVKFLRAHWNDSIVVTLDIGANNVDGCVSATGLDLQCALDGINTASTQLSTTILSELTRAAGPHTRFVGMNYYDPFLAAWLAGTTGQYLAQLSLPLGDLLNADLQADFGRYRIPVADVASAFDTNSLTPLVPVAGQQVPEDVAQVCALTWMCVEDNIHANDAGYQVLADAFLAQLKH